MRPTHSQAIPLLHHTHRRTALPGTPPLHFPHLHLLQRICSPKQADLRRSLSAFPPTSFPFSHLTPLSPPLVSTGARLHQVCAGQHQVLHRARRGPSLHVPGLHQGGTGQELLRGPRRRQAMHHGGLHQGTPTSVEIERKTCFPRLRRHSCVWRRLWGSSAFCSSLLSGLCSCSHPLSPALIPVSYRVPWAGRTCARRMGAVVAVTSRTAPAAPSPAPTTACATAAAGSAKSRDARRYAPTSIDCD